MKEPLWQRRIHEDRRRDAGAPVEVAYAFYPGTGGKDALEYNCINAPVAPLWKTPRIRTAPSDKDRVRLWLHRGGMEFSMP